MNISPIIAHWAFNNEFLDRRMSFICGPRQVGKTTLTLICLKKTGQEKNYYNWDTITVRRAFIENHYFFLANIPEPPPSVEKPKMPRYIVAFDEFHKNPKWKETLKGYYDELGSFIRFIVCGSARLDMFRKSGESLLGRYFLFKMFPLGPKDITGGEQFEISTLWNPSSKIQFIEPKNDFKAAVEMLFHLTGFPEPFIKGEKDFYNRWRDEHISLLTTEEIRDLSRISNIVRLQNLCFLLPERVGSPISINNLAQALSCSYATVGVWLDALEQVYMIFRVPPYSTKLVRTIQKEKKVYFWDWGILEDEGKRFENFLALQLFRAVSAWNEYGWGSFGLYFIRTRDGKEVDFLITKDRKPFMLVEAKLSETNPEKALFYFKERLETPLAFQVIWNKDTLRQVSPGVFIIDIFRFLSLLV